MSADKFGYAEQLRSLTGFWVDFSHLCINIQLDKLKFESELIIWDTLWS